MDNRTIRLSELERAREYVASSMHDRDKSWGDLVRKGERDDCPEMRMVLKAMASEAALSALPAVEGWLGIESAPVWEDDILIMVTGGRYIPPQLIRSDGDYWRTAKLKAVPTHYMPLPAPPIE